MSPIEARLLSELRLAVPDGWTLFDHTNMTDDGPHGIGKGDENVMLFSNEKISTYRCDFLFITEMKASLVVECDGHDFHDRTKQQAAYDRARDREILLLGTPTIRFTGSEIVHSPERCAAEIYAIVVKLNDQRWALCREYADGHDAGMRRAAELRQSRSVE